MRQGAWACAGAAAATSACGLDDEHEPGHEHEPGCERNRATGEKRLALGPGSNPPAARCRVPRLRGEAVAVEQREEQKVEPEYQLHDASVPRPVRGSGEVFARLPGVEELFEPVQVVAVQSGEHLERPPALPEWLRIAAVAEELPHAAVPVQDAVHEESGIADLGGPSHHVRCAIK